MIQQSFESGAVVTPIRTKSDLCFYIAGGM